MEQKTPKKPEFPFRDAFGAAWGAAFTNGPEPERREKESRQNQGCRFVHAQDVVAAGRAGASESRHGAIAGRRRSPGFILGKFWRERPESCWPVTKGNGKMLNRLNRQRSDLSGYCARALAKKPLTVPERDGGRSIFAAFPNRKTVATFAGNAPSAADW